jgi:hypothetical protein
MHYIIYKITNTINNKIYIGQHKTEDINDSYMGSGLFLLKAFKKYGKDNFKKDILFVFESWEEMNNKEIELVNETFIKDRNNYNIVTGGNNGLGRFPEAVRKEIGRKISKALTEKDDNGVTLSEKIYIKRTNTILQKNQDGLKLIGKKSSITQIKNGKSNGKNNWNFNTTPFTIYDNNDKPIVSMLISELNEKHTDKLPPKRMIQLSLKKKGVPMYRRNGVQNAKYFRGWYALYNNHERTDDIAIYQPVHPNTFEKMDEQHLKYVF